MTLYAARGTNQTTSNLYSVDPVTGILTSIGPIGRALTGMAWDATTSTMFGAVSNNSAVNVRSLITVDLVTGAGTLVGAYGVGSTAFADIACDSAGNLFGWATTFSPGGLYSIDKLTGAATWLGQVSAGNVGGGLVFDVSDNLWEFPSGDAVGGGELYSVDPVTGVATLVTLLTGYGVSGAISAATIGPDGILYASDNTFVGTPPAVELLNITYPGGVITHQSDLSVTGVDALAFNVPPGSPPASAPTPPTLAAATAGSGSVTLIWTVPISDGGSAITGYNVYRGTTSGGETLLISLGATTSYVDSSVANGVEYFYKVTAVNAIGESGLSNELSATAGLSPHWVIAYQVSGGLDLGCYGIAYSPSLNVIVAVGNNNADTVFIVRSTDAARSWTAAASQPDMLLQTVCWSDTLGLFVAGGYAVGSGHGALMSSADGNTWTYRGPLDWEIKSVIWAGELGKFVAVGSDFVSPSSHISMTSTDGITWTPGTAMTKPFPFSFPQAYSVAWSGVRGIFVLFGLGFSNTVLCTSPDGVTWQPRLTGDVVNSFNQLASVVWLDSLNLFVAAVQTARSSALFPLPGIGTSGDGINWTPQATSPFTENADFNALWAAVIGKSETGLALAGGYGYPFSLASSLDGVHWSGQPSPFDGETGAFDVIASICGIPELGITVVGFADL